MNKEIILTEHVVERAMERANLNRKKARRTVLLAIERGKTAECSQGMVCRYLKGKTHINYTAVEYNGFCYIVEITDEYKRGITMYPLPNSILKGVSYDGKIKIRDTKKYARFHN